MNDHFFSVINGLTTAASVIPYSGGDIVLSQREMKNLKINQFINLKSKSL